jgi:DNA-binding transcriptional regulator YbjK
MVTEPRQERSRVRREALLRAAIALRAEGGARAVTHRAVAARAGLPPASTTYYFESIQQLNEEALSLHVADRAGELDELVSGAVTAGRGDAIEIGNRLAEALADRATDVVVAQYEIYLEAVRNPNVRPSVADALDAFEQLTVELLTTLGARDPEGAAPAVIALVDGFTLHRLARPRPRDREVELLRGALRALFLAQVGPPAPTEPDMPRVVAVDPSRR